MKKALGIFAVILSLTLLASCEGGTDDDAVPTQEPAPTPNQELVKNTINATITLEDGDEIVLELYPDLAPETVENFVELAEDGFYDGTVFHRVIEGFMIQGGGYDENMKEKKTDTIKGEFAANGFENSLAHDRGVISMARTSVDMDSASSQFFIMQEYAPHLDGQYAAFGKVIEGLDVVDDIASVKTGAVAATGMTDVPIDPIVIESITINDPSADKSTSEPTKSSKATPTPKAKASSKPSESEEDGDGEDDDMEIAGSADELTEEQLESILNSISS